MTYDEKIQLVRGKIYEQERFADLGKVYLSLEPVMDEAADFLSLIGGFSTEGAEPTVAISTSEIKEILKGLEKEQLIKIIEIHDLEAFLEVFPLKPSPIKPKALELMAKAIGDAFSGSEIVDTLMQSGIARYDIPYPGTKWRVVMDVFTALGTSPNPTKRSSLATAITAFLHPLNFNYDESKSEQLVTDFNKYLKYDGLEIVLKDDKDGYKLIRTPAKPKTIEQYIAETPPPTTPEEAANLSSLYAELGREESDYSDQVEYETKILQQPTAAEHLAVIREAYQTLVAITSSFCVDPTEPSRQLNTAYTELSKIVVDELNTFTGDYSEFMVFSFDAYKDSNFGIPFKSLYSAELDFKKKGLALSWNEIRPQMNAVLGQIEDLCQTAGSPDVIAEPKVQKIVGDAMLLLSEIAAERKKNEPIKSEPVMKMEIASIPELRVRNVEDAPIQKGAKRVYPPKFNATEWSKVTIRFVSERDVVIVVGDEQKPSNYVALGFENGKTGKPDSAWMFLYGLALNGGATELLDTPISSSLKQHKKTISDRLKTLFKNDVDPFYDPTDSRVYRMKITLIPPDNEPKTEDPLGVGDFFSDMDG
jgi:hypothetical protein